MKGKCSLWKGRISFIIKLKIKLIMKLNDFMSFTERIKVF